MNPQPGGSLLVAFQVKNKHALVLGGGDVAMGRVNALLSADSAVTIVAPELTNAALKEYIALQMEDPDLSMVRYIPKTVVPEYTEGSDRSKEVSVEDVLLDGAVAGRPKYSLVLTALNTATGVNERVYALCSPTGYNIPVNVADVPSMCDFYFASMIRRGPLQVAVSTGGSAPRLSRRIRMAIEQSVDDLGGVDQAIANISKLRQALRSAPAASTGGTLSQGEKVKVIKERMKWMSAVCDEWTFEEMAKLDEDEIKVLVDSYPNKVAYAQVRTEAMNAPLD